MSRNLDQQEQLRRSGYFGEEIVTGEGVALELPSVAFLTRITAGIIDYPIYLLLLILTFHLERRIFNLGEMYQVTEATARILLISTVALWFWIIPALVTTATRGSSLGKWATGSRLVRYDGGTVTARQAFLRSAVGVLEIWVTLGTVATMTTMLSSRGQRLGDISAGTYVVRWPRRVNWNPNIFMPPTMQEWAGKAQTRELPGGLASNISDHFRMAKKMLPAARDAQARVLAASAEAYVSPPPPWGTPPEDFLAALMLVRHGVEFQRGAQERYRQTRPIVATARLPFNVPDPA